MFKNLVYKPWVLVLLLAVLAGILWYANEGGKRKTVFQGRYTGSSSKILEIRITENGFEPKKLEINSGDTVRWINARKDPVWPASDPHPTHELGQPRAVMI